MATDAFQGQLASAADDLKTGRREAAERTYRDILTQAPGHAVAMHYLGVTLMQSGRADEGLALLARSMETLQGEASYHHNYGLMLAQAGRLADAEREMEATIALAPRAAMSHHYLGIVRQQRGRLEEAERAYRTALELAPGDPLVAANYGYCLLERGDAAAAVEWLRRATAGAPDNAIAHNNLGCALRATGALQDAIASARNAVAIAPHYAPGWYNLGIALRDSGDSSAAFDAFCRAVREGPDFVPAWQSFADEFMLARFAQWDPGAAEEVTRALRHPAVDPGPLAGAAASLLMLDPDLGVLFKALQTEEEDGVAPAWFEGDRLLRIAHPMLLALIENAVAPDPDFEASLAGLRRRALVAWLRGGLKPSGQLEELLGALAQQCFLNEYVWPETDAEAAGLERLMGAISSSSSLVEALLLASYRPLGTVAGRLPVPGGAGAAARVWQRQLEEPARERALREAIPVLTPIDDATSQAVRHQYEQNPYPRWHRLPGSSATPFPLRRAMRSLFPRADLSRLRVSDSPDILLAGCGTGFQVAVTAARNPGAQITALDLSRASLAYAARRCSELGFTHVRFAQADILKLRGWDRRFECVECTGVLHHLRDPIAGWAVLASLVKSGGVMHIALYSALARRGVAAARELVAGRGFESGLKGIRAARALVLAQPPGSAVRQVLDSPDFYTASGARDLMLHVEEHCFNTKQIAEAIDALGLVFLGFELADSSIAAEYRKRFPDDPSATSLENWGRFEMDQPNIFAGMYQFWAAKPA